MSGIFCCGVITALLLFNSTEINSPHIYSTFFTVMDYFTFESVKDLFLYFVEAWDLILSINPVQLYELYYIFHLDTLRSLGWIQVNWDTFSDNWGNVPFILNWVYNFCIIYTVSRHPPVVFCSDCWFKN